MLDTGRLLAFVTTALVVIVVPGPGVLFIVSRGVSLGRRAAPLTVFGHFLGLMAQVAAVAASRCSPRSCRSSSTRHWAGRRCRCSCCEHVRDSTAAW